LEYQILKVNSVNTDTELTSIPYYPKRRSHKILIYIFYFIP
jgi:hypothetical protein